MLYTNAHPPYTCTLYPSQETHTKELASPINFGWANGTIDDGRAFTITPQQTWIRSARGTSSWPGGELKVDEVKLQIR